jgi:glyoxylase I family protein
MLSPDENRIPPSEVHVVQIHHVSLFVRDADRSLKFYRDALGFHVLVDREFEGEWPTLFGVESNRLRAVILAADPNQPNAGGGVELVTFARPVPDGPPPSPPMTATVMLALHVDLEAVLPALLAAGATDLRRGKLSRGTAIATLRDPDGILVELIDAGGPGHGVR